MAQLSTRWNPQIAISGPGPAAFTTLTMARSTTGCELAIVVCSRIVGLPCNAYMIAPATSTMIHNAVTATTHRGAFQGGSGGGG